MKCLLIDDDPFALRLLAKQLAAIGVDEAVTCDNAQEALRVLDRAATFDALFVDLNMPGMDGVEFLRHVAKRRYRGGLVLVSGEDDRILQSVAKLARAHRLRLLGSLHKPVSLRQLEDVLEELPLPGRQSVIGSVRKNYGADELAAALAGGEIVTYHQPKVELATGEVVGVEALARWNHPHDGLLLPEHFVPVAEAHGLAGELARAVLARTLRDAQGWRDAGLRLQISVNVSIDALVVLEFPDQVAAAAQAAGIAATDLVFEVTESQLMRDPLALLDIANRLRLKRIGLAIDDFGTGFSSLAQLRDIPFDEMKLDRSFVHGAGANAALRTMLEANIGMARQLGIRTVAEGIEDRSDWDCLRALGCDCAQGWFIARPMPAAQLPGWVAQWRNRHRDELPDAS